MRPLYIFDLDGTLALIEHRRHLVDKDGKRKYGEEWKPNWSEFYKRCVDDRPNWPVIHTLQMLHDHGAEVRIFSGRSNEVYQETYDWLLSFVNRTVFFRMRIEGDYTPDDVLKKRWLDEMPWGDRSRLAAVFDDRDRVVKMWRANGVACFQVAPGDF